MLVSSQTYGQSLPYRATHESWATDRKLLVCRCEEVVVGSMHGKEDWRSTRVTR